MFMPKRIQGSSIWTRHHITTAHNESTLSRANENRAYHIYEGLGLALIKQVQPLYSKVRLEYLYQQD